MVGYPVFLYQVFINLESGFIYGEIYTRNEKYQ